MGWGAYAVETTGQEEGSGTAARASGKGEGESPQGWRRRCPGPTSFHLLQSCCSEGEERKWGDAQGS